MDSKKLYLDYYSSHPRSFSIFQNPYWLDTVCGDDHWCVLYSKNEDKGYILFIPYYRSKIYGQIILKMPNLTPYLGPVFVSYKKYIPFSDFEKSSDYNTVMTELLNTLPNVFFFSQRLHPMIKNHLPYNRLKYNSETFYTYRLSLESINSVYANLKSKLKNTIKKADKQFIIEESINISKLYELLEVTFQAQGLKPHYSAAQLIDIHLFIKTHKCGQLLLARDLQNTICGGILVVWDHYCAYNLAMSVNKNKSNNGLSQLLLWKGICLAVDKGLRVFDFEGGMIPNIENVYRVFRGELTPYFHIYKARNKVVHLLNELRK